MAIILAETYSLEVRPEDVYVVREFEDVLPEDSPGLLSEREIDFALDVYIESKLISIPLYWLAFVELRELETQL